MDELLIFLNLTPNLNYVSQIQLQIGHVKSNGKTGYVHKGDKIGDVITEAGQFKIAYQITFFYKRLYYIVSPTLLTQENGPWPCVPGSPYDCKPTPNDFP
jgi:hypothetical protein